MLSCVLWAVLATGVEALAELKGVRPGLLGSLRFASYARLHAVADTFVVFGFLSTAAFGAAFAILPRLAGIRLHNEILGASSIFVWTLTVFAGTAAVLVGGVRGRPLAELPVAAGVALVVVALVIAYNVLVTLARRRERTLYAASWYLVAALVALPVLLVAGQLSFPGVRDAIVSAFYVNGMQVVWLAVAGIGIAYWVVPEATGNPLHSRKLAIVGFWTLAFAGGWCGGRLLVGGPAPDWLESLGTAMTAVLLVPVLTATTNLFATARGAWESIANDYGLRFAAVGIASLAVWVALSAVSSTRSIARLVGLTSWDAGVGLFGTRVALGSLAFALVYAVHPRLVGRAWFSRSLASFHFWGSLGGLAVAVCARLGAGLVQAGAAAAYAADADPSRFTGAQAASIAAAHGLRTVAVLGLWVAALAQLALAWNAYRTSRFGEPLVLPARSAVPVGSVV